LSAHARYAAYTARACGYGFQSLDGADGYCFEVRDGARKAVFAAGAGSPYALNDARAASVSRDKAFCAEALQRAQVPVLPGRMYFATSRWVEMRSPGREPDDARAYARSLTYPIFCKPNDGSNGLFAEVIDSPGAFDAYLERVGQEHFAILIQPYVRAPEYRVFVLNGRPLFSYRKRLPDVVGDGVSSLAMLAAQVNAVALPRARDVRGEAVQAEAVLPDGAYATLEGPANRAAGGGACALRDGAEAHYAELALASAGALGLRLAGVDMFDLAEQGGAPVVIEVNSNPMIATLEDAGRWDLIETIWRANFDAALR
jgi:glutathione synthase/RimK-type ligase-like ATP-grasp enzyme